MDIYSHEIKNCMNENAQNSCELRTNMDNPLIYSCFFFLKKKGIEKEVHAHVEISINNKLLQENGVLRAIRYHGFILEKTIWLANGLI